MDDQRGEVVIAVMVVVMGVMMIFSGLHRLHEERGYGRYERDHAQIEHRRHRDDGMQHMHSNVNERSDIPAQDEDQ